MCLRPFVCQDKDIYIKSNICCGKDFFAIYFKVAFKIIGSLIKIKSSLFAFIVNEKLKFYAQNSIFCDIICATFRPHYLCSAKNN